MSTTSVRHEAVKRGPVVLVTGAGNSVGVSIFKALRASVLNPRIVATDAQPLSSGLFRADVSYVLPWARDEAAYLKKLQDVCLAEQVAMICCGSDPEMLVMAKNRDLIEVATGAKVIVNSPDAIDLFQDKWATVQLLAGRDLPVPDSLPADNPEDVQGFLARHAYPIILKGRRGTGSKQVHVVKDRDALELLLTTVPLPMLQEYLWPDDEEYTIGVYRSQRSGYVGQIVFRRTLAAGLTYKAEVVRDDEIERVCRAVVDEFDLWGPVNIQLRKTEAGVRIFEINLRFSSSAVMRAHFGFNEPEMCLRDRVLGEQLEEPLIRHGVALRYWDEVYLESHEYAPIPSGRRTGRSGVTDGLF
jgi:carbamoyl-phosphate synthase large subunit